MWSAGIERYGITFIENDSLSVEFQGDGSRQDKHEFVSLMRDGFASCGAQRDEFRHRNLQRPERRRSQEFPYDVRVGKVETKAATLDHMVDGWVFCFK